MGEGKVVQERLEDGELGLQRFGIAVAQGSAMGCVVVRLQARACERREAWRAAAIHGDATGLEMMAGRCGVATRYGLS